MTRFPRDIILQRPTLAIHVYTGNRAKAGTTAKVRMILHAELGQRSETIVLNDVFKRNFRRGQVDSFLVGGHSIGSLTPQSKIIRAEMWMSSDGFSSDWFLEKVLVENTADGSTYIFPWLRWIKNTNHRQQMLPLDTWLPHSGAGGGTEPVAFREPGHGG